MRQLTFNRPIIWQPLPGMILSTRLMDILWLLVFAALLVACVVWAVSTGSYGLDINKVVQALLTPEAVPERQVNLVWELRLPRIMAAVLCGAALSVAGVIMQAITRNPLASPGLTGVESGASVTLLVLLILLPNALPHYLLPLAALIGGGAVAAFVYILASLRGFSPLRLILVGVGITALLSSVSDLLITYGDIERVESALIWLSGSLHQVTWPDIQVMAWWSIAGLLVWSTFRTLNLLRLGDSVALSRGVNPKVMIPVLLLLAVALTSAAVATVGTLSFVGLMAPHIARRFCGDRHGVLIPMAAMVGGLMVLLGDTIGRILFAPLQLPSGLVIVMIGAPYFVFLMRKMRH
ncbi:MULTISPECIES: iron ABC transporter permease [Marinomonas]|uniref:Iron complex transport system permease protein n=1 Tax=Marinomonas alcarazii TaxID=491949 RepID=A0A318V9C6_9GAMM|nr:MULTISPECIES: iron ABC transporter permease [Marinomonas]PYF84510.1 iron complex transport system permease protein [Marinomonas alcarazii]